MLALLPVTLLAVSGGHPDSQSRTQIAVQGERATVELRFQALSLIEVLPELDRVPDGMLDPDELAAGRETIAGYLGASLRLFRVTGEREEPLAVKLESLVPQDPGLVAPMELQQVDARLVFQGQGELAVLSIESRLFHETNPWHRDLASLAWNGATPVYHTFEGGETSWRFEPAHVRRPSVFAGFLRLGCLQVLRGAEHLAFLLALLAASRRLVTLLFLVAALTLAHSLALTAEVVGWVHLSPRFVELAVALSIAYVACESLLRREARDPWLEAVGFGFLHGLGFAALLAQELAGEPLVFTALFAFDLGVLLARLAVVLAVGLLFLAWQRRRGAGAPLDGVDGLVPRPVRLVLSGLIAVLGFYWFIERAGWS